MKQFTPATDWIPLEEAKGLKKEILNNKELKRGQIKLSSYRWADDYDHSKGYLARVLTTENLHIIIDSPKEQNIAII